MADHADQFRGLVESVATVSEENAASIKTAASSSEQVTASTGSIIKAVDSLTRIATLLRDAISELRL